MSAFAPDLPEDSVYDTMKSPVGELSLVASKKGLHAVWMSSPAPKHLKRSTQNSVINKAKKQLKEYFLGKRNSFDLPLVLSGTSFQQKAWRELCKIPYGKTISYEEQAKRLGDRKKCRAVGTANSQNPISIIVPCHRVIAKSGHLSGYGGGIDNKKLLLELESQQLSFVNSPN
jgi:methylated-DNA-[protein]-cysteine S-methyltransferase